MKTLVVGATGATGRILVAQLLSRGHDVTVIVRDRERVPIEIREHPDLTLIEGSLLELSAGEMADHVRGCGAVASCLGHTLSFKGVFGAPRRLVTEATRRLIAAIRENNPGSLCRFVLMNTAGNRNRDLDEPVSFPQRLVIGLLRLCLPPHADNEEAADFLRSGIGRDDDRIEWVVVRPDGLIDLKEVTDYELHASPTRSAIFDAGETSRINVAHFMADLMVDSKTWETWKGRMPVIYNRNPMDG